MSVLTRFDGFEPILHAKFPQPTLAIDMLLLTWHRGRSVCLDRGWHVVRRVEPNGVEGLGCGGLDHFSMC